MKTINICREIIEGVPVWFDSSCDLQKKQLKTINIYCGPSQGVVVYEVACFFENVNRVFVCTTTGALYELNYRDGNAFPSGIATPLFKQRMFNDEFFYYKQKFTKLSESEENKYVGLTYVHIAPMTPDCLKHLITSKL